MFIVHRKHLNKVLDMLQVVNKEAQSLLLAFRVSAAEFEYLFAGQGILRLEQQYFLCYDTSSKKTHAQSQQQKP